MTELFVASMDDFSSTEDILKVFDSNEGWTYDPTGGIEGRGALTCLVRDTYLTKLFRPVGATAVNHIRFYRKFKSTNLSPYTDFIGWFLDSTKRTVHKLRTDQSGRVELSLSNNESGSALFYKGSTNICDGAFHTIQVYIQAGTGLAGAMKVWIDDVLEIDREGFSTHPFDAATYAVDNFDEVRIASPHSDSWLDDLIIWNDEPGGLTGKISGNPSLIPLTLSGAGDETDLIATAGANWENVNELGTHDGNITAVSSATAGDKDLYTVSAFPGGLSTIASVFVTGFGRADESAQANARLKIKSGTTEESGATELFTGSAYKPFTVAFPQNPETSAPWSINDTIQTGVEII